MTHLQQCATHYFENHLGVTLEALLAPVDPLFPAGKSLRAGSVYSTIEKARRQDDASLPLGSWEHDLKRADWARVDSVAIEALQTQSKDMQLVGWLLESQINQHGFAAIAPCMVLMQTLLEKYWDSLYPQIEDHDLEYRANIICWISEKLLPALRLSPVTGSGREREYNCTDWEQARRNEQLKASAASRNGEAVEGVILSEFTLGVAATPSDVYLRLQQTINEALLAIETLTQLMDKKFGSDAPSLGSMTELLQQILSLAEAELHKRGVKTPQKSTDDVSAAATTLSANAAGYPTEQTLQPAALSASGAIRDRADAYARLAETADFLMRLDPHSPVPYLVRRATEWGQLNTVELYQELFLKLNGQLNIFEMLGLQLQETNTQHN